ncbi:MAG: NAD-dependent epimerase/dehydratase family protein [Bacteroidales bacterium]
MILVTGATGLIGSHLLYHLVSSGEQVRILLRERNRLAGIRKVFSYYSDDVAALLEHISIVEGNMLDMHCIEDAMQGISGVYHCAAMVSFNPSEKMEVIENNRQVAANLVNGCLAAGVKKLVHVSSTSAVGFTSGAALITEDTEWQYHKTLSGYSISKHESEREAWRGEAEGLDVAIVNPAMVLGPGNWGESSTQLIKKSYEGLLFYTEGVNAYVDVRDVAEAMIRLMHSNISGERFILAAENISFRELFTRLAGRLGVKAPRYHARKWMAEMLWRIEWLKNKLTGKPPLISKETARTACEYHYYSSEKVTERLGFTFRPLDETIAWTCRMFLRDQENHSVKTEEPQQG